MNLLTILLALLVQTLIAGPLQSELNSRLAKAGVPAELGAQIKSCLSRGIPSLVERASNEPGWAVGIALDVWLKRTPPERVLDQASPNCRPAIDAARPYF